MPLSNAILSTMVWVFGGHHSAHQCPTPAESAGLYAGVLVEGVIDNVHRWNGAVRPEPPQVLLRESNPRHADPAGEVVSIDVPEYWTVVRYAPLSVEVSLPTDVVAPARIEQILLLLDGQPVENHRYLIGPREPSELMADGRLRVTYMYDLPCPELGKHLIQARYKIDGVWSALSSPLRYEVRLPVPPRIIAVADANGHPMPLAQTGLIAIQGPKVKVSLANVIANDKVAVYLNGTWISTDIVDSACCLKLSLREHLVSGIHRLQVRTVHGTDACSITSEPSNEIVFQYHDEEVYLLRPGRDCNNAERCADVHYLPTASATMESSTQQQREPQLTIATSAARQSVSVTRRTVKTEKGTQNQPAILDKLAAILPFSAETAAHRSAVGAVVATAETREAEHASAGEAVDENGAPKPSGTNGTPPQPESVTTPQPEADASQANIHFMEALVPPPSPFYFASAAYFPIRDFGLRGEVIDRQGAIIHEDMKFSFDHNGNYRLEFALSTPAVPVTIRLQLLVQPATGAPWYTITLPPMQFRPEEARSGLADKQDCNPEDCTMQYNRFCSGRSEILRRCYTQMGTSATIRREGTARFGYGFEATRQAAAF